MTDGAPLKIKDTNNVPVIFINDVVGIGFLNGVLNITMATARFTPEEVGGAVPVDLIIASRLRLDLRCAQQLRDMLSDIIEKNTKQSTVN